MGRNFWIIIVLVVAAFAGLFIASGGKNEEGTGNKRLTNPREIQTDDHVKGAGTSGVTLIEYGDFECPGCGALFPVLQQIEAEFGDQITVAFRHFPLVSIHPNAMAAHRASEAAANQGQFWEMHDLLFERQAAWRTQSASQSQAIALFEEYAQELGLDIEQFNTDVESGTVFDFISAHIDSGTELGFTGTPSLMLNGEEIDTPSSLEEFRTIIQEAIDEAGEQPQDTGAEGLNADETPASTEPEETPTDAQEADEQ